MKDSQNSKKGRELETISSVKQLLSSYLVAKALVEIRQERVQEIKDISGSIKLTLATNDEYMKSLFERFVKLVNNKEVLVGIAKIGLEDIEKYSFEEDPSVKTDALQDTKHLANIFDSNYALFQNINLKEHTLRVFDNALTEGESKGRVIDIALPILAALFHDFGKSEKIRDELLGSEIGKSYREHAAVSKKYIEEVIRPIYPSSGDSIDLLEYLVANHHPSQNKHKNNQQIAFINAADIKARKKEMEILKEKLKKK